VPRNELLLKLFFGAQAGPETVIGYVERMANREGAYLEKFRQIERELLSQMRLYPDAPYWRMALRSGNWSWKHIALGGRNPEALRKMEAGLQRRAIGKEKRHAANSMLAAKGARPAQIASWKHLAGFIAIMAALLVWGSISSTRAAAAAQDQIRNRATRQPPIRDPDLSHALGMDWALLYFCWAGVRGHGGNLWDLAAGVGRVGAMC